MNSFCMLILHIQFSIDLLNYKWIYIKNMMLYVMAGVILLVAYLAYKWLIKPRKQLAHYAQLFKKQGYKVVQKPFIPYTAPFYDELFQDAKTKNDFFYSHKNIYPSTDIIVTNMLVRPSIILMNPDLLKQVMGPEKVMILPKECKMAEVFYSIVKNGLVAVEGKKWKHRRKLISKVFNYDFITSLIPEMVHIANRVFDDFESRKQNRGSSSFKMDLQEMMVYFTSSVVVTGFLGLEAVQEQYKDKSIVDSLLKLVELGANSLGDPLLLMFGEKLLKRRWRKQDRQFLDLLKDVNDILRSYVKKIADSPSNTSKSNKNIIELLLDERRKDQGSKDGEDIINDDELVDEIKTFTVAGSDTTSNFLTTMILYIFEKPEVLRKLTQEIDSVIGSDKDITVENFKKMPYLDCVINETSRLCCTVGGLFQRQLIEDTVIGGVPVAKGVLIDTAWISIFFNPQTFENPLEFIPQRWEKEQSKQHLHLLSLLFSGGPRGCIGKGLAMVEIKLMAIKFLQRYDRLVEFGLKDGKRAYDLRFVYVVKDSTVEVSRRQ